jgi:hypothetical protein
MSPDDLQRVEAFIERWKTSEDHEDATAKLLLFFEDLCVVLAEPVAEPAKQQKRSSQPRERLTAIRDLLRTTSGEWTAKQLAAQFRGRMTQKRLDAISEHLELMEFFGKVISTPDDEGIIYWQYTEFAKAA